MNELKKSIAIGLVIGITSFYATILIMSSCWDSDEPTIQSNFDDEGFIKKLSDY